MRRRLVVAALCAACASPEEQASPEELAATLAAPGPWDVGHRTVELTYRPLAADEDRTIPVELWYPAARPGALTASYGVAGLLTVPSERATANAEPAAGPFPVAVYSHGSGGVGALGFPYAERMASHGWVVAAPDHVGNTSLDLLFDGFGSFVLTALFRPQDVSAALDALEDGVAGLEGAADPSRSVVIGHSFGAFTALVGAGAQVDPAVFGGSCPPDSLDPECQRIQDPAIRAAFAGPLADPRIVAIAPQAPPVVRGFTEGSLAAVEAPALLMSGNLDGVTPHAQDARPAWEALDGPDDVWVRLPEGQHYSFITLCDVLDEGLRATIPLDFDDEGCGPEAPPTAEVVPAMATWALAFARWQVLGERRWSAVFDVELTEHAQVRRR